MKAESLSFGIVVIIKREEIKTKHPIDYIYDDLKAKPIISILTRKNRICIEFTRKEIALKSNYIF